ncbi:MAG: hypothetical protein U0637_08615 [Phycisphaerales bacterium]
MISVSCRSTCPCSLLVGCALAALASPAGADEAVVQASADTCIFAPLDETERCNGMGAYLHAGVNSSGNVRRALLRFDVASSVPAGATITGVTMTVFCDRAASTDPLVFSLHRVQGEWGEGASDAGDPGGSGAPAERGDATWLHRVFPEVTWDTSGGDFDPAASSTLTVPDVGSYTFPSSASMVSDAQSWLDHPETNNGLILLGDETGSFARAARRFGSRENPTASERPHLTVTYTPPAGCDSVDFNNDGLFPDTADIDDFLSVFSGGSCSNDPNCGDVDFNNDGLFPDTTDIDSLLSVFSGGPCL